jgi:hypothetical protein
VRSNAVQRWPRRLLVAAASVLALAGLGQVALARTDWLPLSRPEHAPAPVEHAVARDGMAAAVTAARWVSSGHEHDEAQANGPGGYAMPLSMMPGMVPEGQMRLLVTLTLTNSADAGRPLDTAKEFVLRDARNDSSWPLKADSFGGLPRLGPASAVRGTLYFDLPPPTDSTRLYVDWKRDGRSIRLAVPIDGNNAGHSHR